MSRTCDEALERLLGSDRLIFTIAEPDEHACRDLLAEVLPRHIPHAAAQALSDELRARAGGARRPVTVTDRWLRLWFLGWRLGP